MKKLNTGFSLAEVVITLSIVGVVAALTLPTLLSVKPNEKMMMFKKAYNLTSRIVYEMINDDSLYPEEGDDFGNVGFANTTGVVFQGQTAGFSGASKFPCLFAAKMNCRENSCAANGKFTTNDGMDWTVTAAADSGYTITVDTNGTKKPNCADGANACTAPDIFTIKVNKYGKLTVDGTVAKDYLKSQKMTE